MVDVTMQHTHTHTRIQEWDFLDLKKVKLTEVGPKKTNNEYGENKFPENFEKVWVWLVTSQVSK